MMPINPPSTYSRFQNLLQKRENQKKQSSFSNNYDAYIELEERLDNLRSGVERMPLTGKNNFSQDNIKVLNKGSSKNQRYGKHCPECQDIYKKNAKKHREIVPYYDANKRVEISS